MQLQVLQDERFSCRSCTDCCRHQYVELFAGEPGKIQGLAWPEGDPLRGVVGVGQHGTKTYLAHRADGACVFLNDSNGLCRIHERFGVEAKPMSCRLFPFQITPTFRGEGAVSARYDCPTVRKNEGEPHAEALPLLREYVDRHPPGQREGAEGFDEITRCHFEKEQIAAVVEFAATMLNGFPRNDQRANFIVYLCDLLSTTAVDELDRAALAGVFGSLKAQVKFAAESVEKKPGLMHRLAFRNLLALHLRRDEDVLDGRATRPGRLVSMTAFVPGLGSFRGLGLIHPAGPLRAAGLFKREPQPSPETFALLWRLVRNKLESFSFMGSANGGRDFLAGLRSLALLYPLVLAAAKQSVASRGSEVVEIIDVDYAVAAIEHSFGRSAALNPKFTRSIETLLLERGAFARLVSTM